MVRWLLTLQEKNGSSVGEGGNFSPEESLAVCARRLLGHKERKQRSTKKWVFRGHAIQLGKGAIMASYVLWGIIKKKKGGPKRGGDESVRL